MKKKARIQVAELALVDLAAKAISAPILDILKTAALSRPRRVNRSAITKRLAAAGYHYPPNPDTWRPLAARFLRRHLPWAIIHVGGHHIAIHDGMGGRAGDYGQCLARIVETKGACQ